MFYACRYSEEVRKAVWLLLSSVTAGSPPGGQDPSGVHRQTYSGFTGRIHMKYVSRTTMEREVMFYVGFPCVSLFVCLRAELRFRLSVAELGPLRKVSFKKEGIKVEQLTWMNPTNQSGLKWFRKAQPKLPQPDYFNTNTATAQSHGAALTFWTL